MRYFVFDRNRRRALVSVLLLLALMLAAVGVAVALDQGVQRHVVGDGVADTPLEMDQLQAQQEGGAMEPSLNPDE